jgi:hypothetical protein
MGAVGNLPEAERFFRDGLAIVERLAKAAPTNAEAQRDLSVIYSKVGEVMGAVGNLPEAERFFRDSLAIREQAFGPDNQEVQRIREQIRRLEGDDQ